jgi:hypothetical protein
MQRRLAAILAADVAGYSRLMEADETGTLARLKSRYDGPVLPTIAEHRGRLVKLMGDGLLAEFSSAVDAVRCAIAVQKIVAEQQALVPENGRLVFRMGVNLDNSSPRRTIFSVIASTLRHDSKEWPSRAACSFRSRLTTTWRDSLILSFSITDCGSSRTSLEQFGLVLAAAASVLARAGQTACLRRELRGS